MQTSDIHPVRVKFIQIVTNQIKSLFNTSKPMKTLYISAIFMFLAIASHAQIVINEFQPDNDRVEIKNLGNQTVNVGSYFLCSFPLYTQISSMTIVSGSTMLMPGQLLVVTGHAMAQADDELGLYTLPQYTNSSAMIDYVEWGFSGHTRSSVAIAAGIWSSGAFVAAPSVGQSWMYDGSGNAPADWFTGEPTFGQENVVACNADAGNLDPIFNPNICSAQGTSMLFSVSGNVGDVGIWLVTDNDGNIVATSNVGSINFDGLLSGTYDVQHLSGFGTISNAFLGDNLDDIEGCFDISGEITINFTQLNAGGININSPSVFCVGDGIEDVLLISAIGQIGAISRYIMFNDLGEMTYIDATLPADLDGFDAGEYTIALMVCDDLPSGLTLGNTTSDLSGCYDLSGIESISLLTGNGCSCLADGGNASSSQATVCLNSNSTNVDFNIASNTGSNFQWIIADADGNILVLPTENNFDFATLAEGSYSVYGLSYETLDAMPAVDGNISDIMGCYDLSNAVEITNELISAGDFSINGETDTFGIFGAPVDFTVSNGSSVAITYVICDTNDEIIATTTSSSYDFEDNGQLNIYAVATNGELTAVVGESVSTIASTACYDISNLVTIDIVSSISENELISLSVYPNPAVGQLAITAGQTLSGSLEVYDSVGKIVFIQTINSDRMIVDFGAFEAGMYIVVVKSNGAVVGREVVVKG